MTRQERRKEKKTKKCDIFFTSLLFFEANGNPREPEDDENTPPFDVSSPSPVSSTTGTSEPIYVLRETKKTSISEN